MKPLNCEALLETDQLNVCQGTDSVVGNGNLHWPKLQLIYLQQFLMTEQFWNQSALKMHLLYFGKPIPAKFWSNCMKKSKILHLVLFINYYQYCEIFIVSKWNA